MKWNEKYLKIGCFASLVLFVCAVGVSCVLFKRWMVMRFDHPEVYVCKPTAQGVAHEAWLLEAGSIGRGWYFFVRKDASQTPHYIENIELGFSEDLAGMEWSRDGALFAVTMRMKGSGGESRVYAYDFSQDKAMTPPFPYETLWDIDSFPDSKDMPQEAVTAAWDRELKALIDAHGGPEGPMTVIDQIRSPLRDLDYREWMKLKKELGWGN
ncbi:MAG: hypothetical protein K1Y02_21505 [Candidatus Hydrogenedentes bacterium]|nr:hypothetical protein [Candidatus Hydrogenedentota bacterium]